MLEQVKLEEFENTLKTLQVKQKKLKNGDEIFYLLTENGAICGIFDSEQTAKQKLPIVAYNLYRKKVPKKLLEQTKKRR